jgi:hypothetical protein
MATSREYAAIAAEAARKNDKPGFCEAFKAMLDIKAAEAVREAQKVSTSEVWKRAQ